jgi:hypothetical protein
LENKKKLYKAVRKKGGEEQSVTWKEVSSHGSLVKDNMMGRKYQGYEMAVGLLQNEQNERCLGAGNLFHGARVF